MQNRKGRTDKAFAERRGILHPTPFSFPGKTH